MKPRDVFVLLGLFGIGVAVYRLANPKCPWCKNALKAVEIGQELVCPSCRRSVTALQALLA